MKTLIVTTYDPPVPGRDVYGIYQRLGMFVRALGRLSDRIDMLHLVGGSYIAANPDLGRLSREQSEHMGVDINVLLAPNQRRQETMWNHYGAGMLALHRQPRFHHYGGDDQVQAVESCLRLKPGLILVHRLAGMCPVLRATGVTGRVFFDLDDVEHRVHLRQSLSPPSRPGKLLHVAQVPAMLAAERRAAALAQATFVCSELDRRYLRRCGIRSNVVVVPNAVSMPERGQPLVAEPTLMFLGTFIYEPNRLAAERLINRIWPLVRARAPLARLIMAGAAAERLPSFAAQPDGVEFTGFVDDLTALYARSRVVCCPLTIGGGTRFKLIEAAGHAKPMVASTVGAEGLAFADGAEILLRDDDASFADACLQLLRDDGLCARLGDAARAKAMALYDRERIQDRIVELMQPPA